MRKIEKISIVTTEQGSTLLLNGEFVNCVNEIVVTYEPMKKPKVQINLDGEVEKIEGYLCTKDMERVTCPKCGKVLAYIVSDYEIACPECGERITNGSFPY